MRILCISFLNVSKSQAIRKQILSNSYVYYEHPMQILRKSYAIPIANPKQIRCQPYANPVQIQCKSSATPNKTYADPMQDPA